MTIGIGVLCSTTDRSEIIPDAIVLISDTMGSSETDSTGELHKMAFDPAHRIFAVVAGRVEIAAELFPLIRAQFATIPQGNRLHGSIWRALTMAVANHRNEHFSCDVVMTQFAIGGQILAQEHERMMEAYRAYDTGYQMLLGTFDDDGRALLYYIGRLDGDTALVHLMEFPGYFAVGTGGYNANMWFNFRRQRLGHSIRRSALHAFEASRMASSAPTVNNDIEVAIALKDRAYYFSRAIEAPSDCPISLNELVALAEQYGPKSTEALGLPTQSASQTSAGQP
jgi:hypothetical protein